MSVLDSVPILTHHTTLHSPTPNTRAWSSRPHLSSSTPLLATASSDKSVHIWDMRAWKLLSTIAGGHKRSVRCVGWRDYGARKRRKGGGKPGGGAQGISEEQGAEGQEQQGGEEEEEQPVILATGSFDANCGLWVWNRDHGNGPSSSAYPTQAVPGSFDGDADDMDQEQDFTNAAEDNDSEEWHFSTLLTGPDSEIKDLQFSPPHYGARLLATCSRDKSVWVWEEVEAEEWETVAVLGEHAGDVKCVTWLGGAVTSSREIRRRLGRRKDRPIEEGGAVADGGGNGTPEGEEGGEDEVILGQRELLASGSYDDTIRLHHDDEAEGDWMTIAVLTGHEGTVWDIKFEAHVNLASYPHGTSVEEVMADWEPRLVSCSDDLTVRVWGKQLSEKERDIKRMRIAEARKGRQGHVGAANGGGEGSDTPIQTGFASNRLPSVIRPPSSTEKWVEEARLPVVHVRSVYAVDWSAKTGLIVSCGGDGLIAVYGEFAVHAAEGGEDVVMHGTAAQGEQSEGQDVEEGDIKKIKTEWKVVAAMEAAHDEYEINHVCWAPVRDQRRQLHAGEVVDNSDRDDEEYIVSTGDDGRVRVWHLPQEVLEKIRQDA